MVKQANGNNLENIGQNTDKHRLNKFIANSGLCSRRKADEIIAEGRVSVNGKLVKEMGVKVSIEDTVIVDGKRINPDLKSYVLINKPKNIICTKSDEKGRKTVMDLLPPKFQNLYPVGRLDRNTTGVLLLTNDGELTQKLLHPSKGVLKVYKVRVQRRITQEELNKLVTGVELEDGVSKFDKIVELSEETYFRYGIEIHSGKNRVIRRMIQAVDNEVVKLDRVLFHTLDKKGLAIAEWRELRAKEVQSLGVKPRKK